MIPRLISPMGEQGITIFGIADREIKPFYFLLNVHTGTPVDALTAVTIQSFGSEYRGVVLQCGPLNPHVWVLAVGILSITARYTDGELSISTF